MLANVVAESAGRVLACQLYRMTDDAGMKDMLRFLVARDTMHQNQWLAAWEELGGPAAHPIPSDFSQEDELQEVSYTFMTLGARTMSRSLRAAGAADGPMDGQGTFETERMRPRGEKPNLGKAADNSAVQVEQAR